MKRIGFVAGAACLALVALAPYEAHAMNGPTAIEIDGGPFGKLDLSGGADGFFYGMNNAAAGEKSTGAVLGNALISLQQTDGVLRFSVEVGAYTAQTLGYAPLNASGGKQNYFPESPLYAGYITIAPNSHFSVAIGQINPLVGFEGSQDWDNASVFFSEVAFTQPGQGRGVNVSVNQGAFSLNASLSDGYFTGVFNYLQFIGTFGPNANNSFNVYGGANLGETGSNVGGVGNPLLNNSTMFGAFYTATRGNLSLTPEVQYQYTRPIARLGIDNRVSNVSAAVFADYQFGSSPYSLGGFVEYATQFRSHADVGNPGADYFGFGPGSSLEGISVTPTWQYKDLFVRADAGYIHVHRGAGGSAFGPGGQENQVSGLLEGGVLF